ncbi:MAG: hypothetical protein HYZ28_19115 [Myxococcales bacterium]|nr:hypothetical protein [Myxococcales bacterium]
MEVLGGAAGAALGAAGALAFAWYFVPTSSGLEFFCLRMALGADALVPLGVSFGVWGAGKLLGGRGWFWVTYVAALAAPLLATAVSVPWSASLRDGGAVCGLTMIIIAPALSLLGGAIGYEWSGAAFGSVDASTPQPVAPLAASVVPWLGSRGERGVALGMRW